MVRNPGGQVVSGAVPNRVLTLRFFSSEANIHSQTMDCGYRTSTNTFKETLFFSHMNSSSIADAATNDSVVVGQVYPVKYCIALQPCSGAGYASHALHCKGSTSLICDTCFCKQFGCFLYMFLYFNFQPSARGLHQSSGHFGHNIPNGGAQCTSDAVHTEGRALISIDLEASSQGSPILRSGTILHDPQT